MKKFDDVDYYTDMITDWLIYNEKDLITFELCDEGNELRAEWTENWKTGETEMYIGFESRKHGNMSYRELVRPTEIEISNAVAMVLTEGKANFDYWEKEVSENEV